MVESGQLPLVKLCDFGFSKDKFDDSAPQTQIGTALFTAPEVFLNVQGRVYEGEAVDLWSCGVVGIVGRLCTEQKSGRARSRQPGVCRKKLDGCRGSLRLIYAHNLCTHACMHHKLCKQLINCQLCLAALGCACITTVRVPTTCHVCMLHKTMHVPRVADASPTGPWHAAHARPLRVDAPTGAAYAAVWSAPVPLRG